MRLAPAFSTLLLLLVPLVACGSAPPRPPPPPPPEPGEVEEPDEEPPPAPEPAPAIDAPERSRPPSTASYEQAMSSPEMLDVNDGRPHLTDDQLRSPMRAVTARCTVPRNVKVTIRTAVQDGRAIGVTVDVVFVHAHASAPVRSKRLSRAAAQRAAAAAKRTAKREAKAKKAIAGCLDRAVRAAIWPPSSRRDSFTTEL